MNFCFPEALEEQGGGHTTEGATTTPPSHHIYLYIYTYIYIYIYKWHVCPGYYNKNSFEGSRAGMGSMYEDRREGGKMKGVDWGGVGLRVEWRGVGRS